jgi:outer membrane biosynthesis protein TonB
VDVDAKIRGIVVPVYPYEFLKGDVGGNAVVTYLIGQNGRVSVTRVASADRPEFGLALQAAVERFEYEPALKNGGPHISVQSFEQRFSTNDSQLCTGDDDRLLRMERKHPEKIVSARTLDEPLKPLTTRSPVYPSTLFLKQVNQGKATIELLVNEEGLPRLPRIVSASEPAFGYAAAQAAVLWTFSHPKVKGEPAVTRIQIPFGFSAGTPKP